MLGLKENGAAPTLIALGLAYGVFHAAGPGHGKAVIAAYLVANERALLKGFLLSLGAALLQALVAIVLVGVLAVVMQATAGTLGRVTSGIELASFAVVAVAFVLSWFLKAPPLRAKSALQERTDAQAAEDAEDDLIDAPRSGGPRIRHRGRA